MGMFFCALLIVLKGLLLYTYPHYLSDQHDINSLIFSFLCSKENHKHDMQADGDLKNLCTLYDYESITISIALIFTARIRRMREGNSFSLCASPHLAGGKGDHRPADGGYPLPRARRGVHPFPGPGEGLPPFPSPGGE